MVRHHCRHVALACRRQACWRDLASQRCAAGAGLSSPYLAAGTTGNSTALSMPGAWNTLCVALR
jgi:hypothetical protein